MTGIGEEFIHILTAGVTDQLLVGIQNVVILRVCLVDQKCTGKVLENIPECKAETVAFLRMKPLSVGQTAVLAAKLYLVKSNICIFEEYRRICAVLWISGISKGNVERVVDAVIFEGSWYECKGFYAAGRILTGGAGKDNRKFIAATSA